MKQSEGSFPNTNDSLDIETTNNFHRPKTVHANEHSIEKYSFSGTSISSNNKTKENDSYKNFISRIKLNYNLMHPKQRIQKIILHSNLDKSMNMSDTSVNDIKNDDINDNKYDNLNTEFFLENSGAYINNPYRRRTINFLNRVHNERLEKGEEEKNNQSAETKKNRLNHNFNNDNFDNNNSKINLGNIFNIIQETNRSDKVFLSQNNFNNNQEWSNEQIDDISNISDNNFNSYKNNPFLGQNVNKREINEKGGKYMNRNFISNMNNLSTNINTNNNNNKDTFFDAKNEDDQKEIISSFNYGINNNSLPNPKNSYFSLGNNQEETVNKNNNDSIEFDKHFTFGPKEKGIRENLCDPKSNVSSIFSNSKKIQYNKTFNIKNNENNHFPNQEDNKSRIVQLIKYPKEINSEKNIIYKRKFYENKNDKLELNSVEKGNNSNIKENNYNINKEMEKESNLSLTVSEIDESDVEMKMKKKGTNLCKSFLYGILFGSTVSGIFWLKNEETRKYFLEKIKGININSIIKFLRAIFSNPIEFFKKIFSDERKKDYIKVIGLTIGKFFDIFESYDDWFRLIGIALSIYLVWLIIKSFIKAFFKVREYYN